MDLPFEIVVTPELAAQVATAEANGSLDQMVLEENPSFLAKYKKHKGVMMKIAGAAAAGVYTYMCMYMCVCIYVCIHVYICVYVYIFAIRIYICM